MWPFQTVDTVAVQAKLSERDAALASAPRYSESVHKVFLDATAVEIVQHIQQGLWTASQVLEAYLARAVEAYLARAVEAHHATNCLTEVFFDQARAKAKELDEGYAATKAIQGPLHGVPVSLKDMINVAGYDSTIGFTTWIGKPAKADATTLLAFECSNPLWGRSLNPWSAAHTCGGSTGGEGALLAADGSAIGIGSDIGGSLRIPAHYCGVYSLKPGHTRISNEGTVSSNPGFQGITAVYGPMGRSIDDLELASRVLFGQTRGYGTPIPPLTFREHEKPKKLRLGYYTSDYFVKASPACKRAILETVEAVRSQGHECIEFKVTGGVRALEIFTALTSADGYKSILSKLGPDPAESAMFLVTLGPKLPGFIHRFATWVSRFQDPIFSQLLAQSRTKSVKEFFDWAAVKEEFAREWQREVWEEHGFDAVIAPVQAVPAVAHNGCDELSPLAAATILYNIVDCPSGCIPVTRVDPEKDVATDEWFSGSDLGSRIFESKLYGKDGAYDPVKMQGLPVGVQIVGKPWEEEMLLNIMREVDSALGPRGFGPGSWKSKMISSA